MARVQGAITQGQMVYGAPQSLSPVRAENAALLARVVVRA